MRLRGIRVGTKFVLEDRGGVWEKTGETRARCIFGSREDYGNEIDVDPAAFAFGLFGGAGRRGEGQADEREAAESARNDEAESARNDPGGMRVVVVDDDTEAVLAEYGDVGSSALAALSPAYGLRLTPSKKRRKRSYRVMDTYVDLDARVLYVEVREDRPIGVPEERDDLRDQVPIPPEPTEADVARLRSGEAEKVPGAEGGV